MNAGLDKYLSEINFEKHLKKLKSRLKNKKIVVYGAGSLFLYIKDNYDLSEFNIIGISDKKFVDEEEGQDFSGFKIIPAGKIVDYKPDYVLISTQNYLGLLEQFVSDVFKDTKIKIAVLPKKPLWTIIKEIWM